MTPEEKQKIYDKMISVANDVTTDFVMRMNDFIKAMPEESQCQSCKDFDDFFQFKKTEIAKRKIEEWYKDTDQNEDNLRFKSGWFIYQHILEWLDRREE